MNAAEYEKMYHQEESSWWFCGRQAIVEAMLEKYTPFGDGQEKLIILDIGCGTGKILRNFEDRGHTIVGLDFSDLALEFTSERGGAFLVRGDAQSLPFDESCFDLIVALDIMEHVPDDSAMATEMLRVLKPDGHAILNVPAHPRLWGEHDVALHHFRRYTKASLRTVLGDAGFEFTRFTYSICFVYPVAFAFRILSKFRKKAQNAEPKSHMFKIPSWINSWLKIVLRVESRLICGINMPMGLSLLTILRKPDQS